MMYVTLVRYATPEFYTRCQIGLYLLKLVRQSALDSIQSHFHLGVATKSLLVAERFLRSWEVRLKTNMAPCKAQARGRPRAGEPQPADVCGNDSPACRNRDPLFLNSVRASKSKSKTLKL